MIKVDALSFKSLQAPQKTAQRGAAEKPVTNPISPDTVLRSMGTLNRSLVSFTGAEYAQTLNENYFQLPKGASPDVFQKAAAANLFAGNDVVVTAPTGTGKTAIAHYAITKNMKDGKKTFYTTPLKALSNEKFRSFQKTYGKENVGLLTGDTKINAGAPIVIMTTEVYRNMVFADKFKKKNEMLNNLKTVVFDELHYLGDVDRGGIWEQSIILSDPKTQLLSLSATVGNNEKVADWMASAKGHPKAELAQGNLENYRARTAATHTVLVNVPPENRHVPLNFENLEVEGEMKKGKGSGSKAQKKKMKKEAARMNASESVNPSMQSYADTVKMLKEKDRIPAIFFVFSKKGSNSILKYLDMNGEKLTTYDEQKEIIKICDRYKEEGKYLGESLNKLALYKGYAVHNSGLLPAQKELVEELFQKKLVKVVLATETLSAGINMPARTTVISATRKPSSTPDSTDGKRELAPNEFHQMAGRAGRRGIDEVGYCYTMSPNSLTKAKFDKLVSSPPNNLESAFRPDYSFIASYYDTCKDDGVIKELFAKSMFAYDPNPQIAKKNSANLLEIFGDKRKILKKMDYIKSDHELTQKGKLLAKLNGYEQLPIIDTIAAKKLGGLSPIELAGAIASLANISDKFDTKSMMKDKYKEPEIFQHENSLLTWFVEGLDSTVEKYNKDMEELNPNAKQIKQDSNAAKHVYEWAKLNSESPNARENWAQLYEGPLSDTIKDEGAVFKELTMTLDLMKQMKDITAVGAQTATSDTDAQYYTELSENIDEAMELLKHEPVVANEKDEAFAEKLEKQKQEAQA